MWSVKSLIAFILLHFIGKPTANNIYPEKIDWDTHFRASPDVASNYAAVTSTFWHYGYNATIKDNKLNINFNFLAGIEPDKSWVNKRRIKDRKTNEILLNHEQGHVYINFLQLKNGEILIKNQAYTVSNFKQLIHKKAKEVSTHYKNLQQRYDIETKHGIDVAAQEKWDIFFKEELDKFK